MEGEEKLPIVLVPGLACSQLEARYLSDHHKDMYLDNSWKIIFLNMLGITNLDYIIEKLRMKPNDLCTDMVNHSSNLLIRPYNFGSVDGVKYIDKTLQQMTYVYKYLIDFLVNSLDYEKNVSIYGAPYDFRVVATQYEMKRYFSNLDELIQLSYTNHRKPCIIITHSMGSMLISEYLHTKSEDWKSHYVDSWISISGAFGGSTKALYVLMNGLSLEYPNFKVDTEISLHTVRSLASLYYMLPNCQAFSNDDIIFQTSTRAYNCNQYDEIFEYLKIKPYSYIKKMLHSRNTTYKTGVPSLFIYSKGKETLSKIILCEDGDPNSKCMKEIFGDGDGTVPLKSLELCHKFLDNDPLNTEIIYLDDVNHSKILKNKTTYRLLCEFIKRRNSLRNYNRCTLRRSYSCSL